MDPDLPNFNGYSALYLVCFKGYAGGDPTAMNQPTTLKQKRECVQILIQASANVNFQTPMLLLTPLHWAAHQGNSEITQLLIDNGAKMTISARGYTPVDFAGFCGKDNIVQTYASDLSSRIKTETDLMKSAKENGNTPVDESAGVSFAAKFAQILPFMDSEAVNGAKHLEPDEDGRLNIVCLKTRR